MPGKSQPPFDQDRDGFVMGEGAGVVVVEEYEHAKSVARRSMRTRRLRLSADAYHLSAPFRGEGASRCMNMALRHAKLNPTDVQYVNAHATSTPVVTSAK